MSDRKVIPIYPIMDTDDNAVSPIFNTVVGVRGTASSTSTTLTARRGEFWNWWLVVPYILCTGQDVTLSFEALVNGSWASALDVPLGYSGGDNTITADSSAQQGFAWRMYPDSNVYITNGGTGPTVLDIGTPYLTNVDPGNV